MAQLTNNRRIKLSAIPCCETTILIKSEKNQQKGIIIMWLKSDDKYIMLAHITYFNVEQATLYHEGFGLHLVEDPKLYEVTAYLDSNHRALSEAPEPAQIVVFRGSQSECHDFVEQKLYQQEAQKWLGYLVAGAVGAILTYLLR